MDDLSIIWMLLVFGSPVLLIWLGYKVWKVERRSAPKLSTVVFSLAIASSLSLAALFATVGGLMISQMP